MNVELVAAPDADRVAERLSDRFAASFDAAGADGVWAAPGRVNLIGEHVDYAAGRCLPMALPHATYVAVRRRKDDRVRVRSRQRPDHGWDGEVGSAGAADGWAAYAAGVLWVLRDEGYDVPGIDVMVDGYVPVGSGLSSSAALECAVAVAVADLADLRRRGTPLTADDAGRALLAAACVRAENEVAGAPTGGMDQAASLRCTADNALLLDTADGSVEQVPVDLAAAGLTLLVVDTRAHHSHADSPYGQRREATERAARRLGVPGLGAVTGEVEEVLSGLAAPDRVAARHVLTEVRRVDTVVDLLRHGRADQIGPALDASHASLRDDYRVSCPELDLAVDTARAAGALGARMTGGGFGGSAIALLPAAEVGAVCRSVDDAFVAAGLTTPRFLTASASRGAHRVH